MPSSTKKEPPFEVMSSVEGILSEARSSVAAEWSTEIRSFTKLGCNDPCPAAAD